MVGKLKTALRAFTNPVLLLLCLAGAIRNGAGLCWAYNILLFFNEYWPGTNVSCKIVMKKGRLSEGLKGSVDVSVRVYKRDWTGNSVKGVFALGLKGMGVAYIILERWQNRDQYDKGYYLGAGVCGLKK